MKLTKSRLIQIIKEELNELFGIKGPKQRQKERAKAARAAKLQRRLEKAAAAEKGKIRNTTPDVTLAMSCEDLEKGYKQWSGDAETGNNRDVQMVAEYVRAGLYNDCQWALDHQERMDPGRAMWKAKVASGEISE